MAAVASRRGAGASHVKADLSQVYRDLKYPEQLPFTGTGAPAKGGGAALW